MKKRLMLLICLATFLFNGCASILMPYAEEPLCKKGISGGYCGNLSEIYEVTKDKQQTHYKEDEFIGLYQYKKGGLR